MSKNKNNVLLLFIALVVVYIAISIGVPPSAESLKQYDLTVTQARILHLSFIIPLSAVWMVAYYGYACFRDYAERVRNTREGPAFRLIERGSMVLVFALPIQGIVSALTNYIFVDNPHIKPGLTITRNYIYMVMFVTAFILIARGCTALLFTVKNLPHKSQPRFITLLTILLSVVFVSLILNQTLNSTDTTYFLPTWLIVATIAVPYLYAWSLGLQGLYDLARYLTIIKGNVYKSALHAVVVGLGAVMALNILIQLMITVTTRITRLNLTPILLVIYLLVFCYAIGFGLMARGSRKLTRIEEA